MKISYTSNKFLIFIIFTACLCLFFAIHEKKPSDIEILTNNDSSLSGLKLDRLPNEDEVLKLFQQWKNHHERVYNDLDVMTNKFEVFVSNLKYIVETNAKRESTLLGLNDFADLSFEEFKETYLNTNDDDTTDIVMNNDVDDTTNTVDIMNDDDDSKPPSSLDWRSKDAVTSVKKQGKCACCWAFAAIGAIEGIVAIKTKTLQDLSVQEVLDCVPEPNNCTGGSSPQAFKWVIGNKGVALKSDYPYKAVKGVCKSKQIPISPTSAIKSFNRVTKSDKGLLCATANQPIKVGFYVTKDFQLYTKTDKIYDGPKCPVGSTKTNHAMLIVGYDSLKKTGEDYWIVKNSWGKGWGSDGYVWIKRNTKKKYGVCAINARASFPNKVSDEE